MSKVIIGKEATATCISLVFSFHVFHLMTETTLMILSMFRHDYGVVILVLTIMIIE